MEAILRDSNGKTSARVIAAKTVRGAMRRATQLSEGYHYRIEIYDGPTRIAVKTAAGRNFSEKEGVWDVLL